MKGAFSVFGSLLSEHSSIMINSEKTLIRDLRDWKFKSPPNYAELPINEDPEYNVPVAVQNAVFSKVPTEPLIGKLHMVCASGDAIKNVLDLDPEISETEEFINFVAGKYSPEGGLTVCHRYGGYQFGYWADQLGDGRAHILGEYVNRKGESWQPQLKGSGETPYSRFGDGRAVLRSSIREMIASEACFYLGIPTTRAAALVVSDEHKVWRDKTYSGSARQERAAVVMRLSPAWYRLGSFEILLKRKEPDTLKRLADFVVKHHFPDVASDDPDKYIKWYSEVAYRNLDMVVTWQGLGFTHGVLNTDNISVLGLTIDYGPFGFMQHYYQHYVPNSSDDAGRYAFNKQPDTEYSDTVMVDIQYEDGSSPDGFVKIPPQESNQRPPCYKIILWNLEKFAEALEPILTDDQIQKIKDLKPLLRDYVTKKVNQTYIAKLGLEQLRDGDDKLVEGLLELMQQTTCDFTATFRQLAEVNVSQLDDVTSLENKWSLAKISKASPWGNWVRKYRERLDDENVSDEVRRTRMLAVNPLYIPSNWIMQEAIADAEKNDFGKVRLLLQIFKNPYEVNEEAEKLGYSSQPPSWSYGLKLSCSS